MAKKITIKTVWDIADVLNAYPELTKKQAEKILDRMKNYTCGYMAHGYEVMAICVDDMEFS